MDRRASLLALAALCGLASLPAGAAPKSLFARADAAQVARRLSAQTLNGDPTHE